MTVSMSKGTGCVSPRATDAAHDYVTTRNAGTHCQHCGTKAPTQGRMVGINHYASA
jgi:hypothetical protein